ncbi:hypothetical protein SAMN05421803_10280 [Nocardiopsis flavescens]|uniref:Uncharacterized protein n=2 Tax=Nocardiopsis flavescens TaxID=758803 RepID=A0A1M6DZ44_9ACTN|nr:hypothetical protein SAMN05421803_10280 [Nocardiopsis flavescens]
MKNKSTRRIGLFSATVGLSIIFSMGVVSAAPATRSGDLETLGSSQGNDEQSANLTAEANQASRNTEGNILSITWSIKNEGNERVVLTWLAGRSYLYTGGNYAGVTIVDSNGASRYHPIMDNLGSCLCSGSSSSTFKKRIEPGEQVAYWSMYSVPENVDSVTLEIPGFEPIEDVPIS